MHKFLLSVLLIASWSKILSAEEITLPKPTGIHSIGTKSFEIKDEKRKMMRGESSRRWMVQAFYPSEKHKGTYPYMPDTLKQGKISDYYVKAYAKNNAPILKGTCYPLIVFIPGLGAERQKYTILSEELASQGYIVLSLDQAYVSNFVRFPDNSKITLTFKDARKLTLDREDRNYRYRYYDQAMDMIINDIIYMLDHIDDINHNFFDNALDVHQTILMGHSFGGNVAHHLGFKDPRIKAVIDIDSKISERKIYGFTGIPSNKDKKPILFIRGMMQYQENLGDQLTQIENAEIWGPYLEHNTFSDDAFLAKNIPTLADQSFVKIFSNWFFKSGPNFNAIDINLGGKDIYEWFHEYRSKIISWLNKTLDASLSKKQSRSPIGDDLHTEVYDFIAKKLLNEKSYSEQEREKFIQNELDILNKNTTDKPFVANLYEGEFSGLLKRLCLTSTGCQEIALYQKDGVGIAYANRENNIKFKEKRDVLFELGFLGKNPSTYLGVKKRIANNNRVYYEIIKSIHYNKERNYTILSNKTQEKECEQIGYIRYIIK